MTVDGDLGHLETVLRPLAPVAVAVSGGVDSMTLAYIAARLLGAQANVYHAVSPAVPPEATERVRRHAARHGWRLEIFDAGEFSDPRYLENPVNRCFFCKTNLYGAIRAETKNRIVSGTNLDDLDDFRPGLQAAAEHDVTHPYVDARIDKAGVRRLARFLGLSDLAELPAAPCLSSRLQTGVAVTGERLTFAHAVERLIDRALKPQTVRCRILHDGFVVELDPASLERIAEPAAATLHRDLVRLCAEHGRSEEPRFQPYRRGSAFVQPGSHGD